jgi:hypothetical protein
MPLFRATLLALCACALSASAQDNPLGRKNAPLPAWLKPGVRVTYQSGSASVPGETRVLAPDANGDWVTPDGRRFAMTDARGTGAMGFQQYTIVAADDKVVAADLRNFLLLDPDVAAGRCMSTGGKAVVGTPDGIPELWWPPAKVAAMEPVDAGGTKISRGKFPWNGKTYDVVTREIRSDKGYTRVTMDLETGLLIAMSSCSVGDPTAVAGPDGRARPGAAWTTVGTVTLSKVRTPDLPWNNDAEAFATWANNRRADYRGAYQTFVPGSPVFEQGMSLSAAFGPSGKTWAPLKVTSQLAALIAGVPPVESTSDRAAAAFATAPFWINPKTLATLQVGQVVDDDPVTKFKTTVANVDDNSVVLLEQGHVDRAQAAYDRKSGALTASVIEQTNGVGRTRIQLRLVEP